MLTQGEFEEILDEHLYSFDGAVCGVPEAAEAIAAWLTRVHLMSEFVVKARGLTEGYNVPDGDLFYLVHAQHHSHVAACRQRDSLIICKPVGEDFCIHIQAVKFWLAQNEAIE